MEAGCEIRIFCLPCERQVPKVSLAKKPSWVVHIFSSYANSRFISGFCHGPFPLWNTLLMSNCFFLLCNNILEKNISFIPAQLGFFTVRRRTYLRPPAFHTCVQLNFSHPQCPTWAVPLQLFQSRVMDLIGGCFKEWKRNHTLCHLPIPTQQSPLCC